MFVCTKGNASCLDKTIDIARFSKITSRQLEMMRFNTAHQVKDVDLIAKGKRRGSKKPPKRKNKQRKNHLPTGKKRTGDEKCRTVVPNTNGKKAQPTIRIVHVVRAGSSS